MNNNSNENKFKFFGIAVLITVIICAIMADFELLAEGNTTFIIPFSINILILLLSPIYYIITLVHEKKITQKLQDSIIENEIDFKYYRDIIDNYSPAVLSYLYDGKIEVKKDLAVSIIYLIIKKYLAFVNGKLEKTKKDQDNLGDDLQLICNNIDEIIASIENQTIQMREKKRKDILISYSDKRIKEWQENIENSDMAKKLFYRRNAKLNILDYILFLYLTVVIIYSLILSMYGLCIISAATFWALFKIKDFLVNKHDIVRTQEGYDVYKKIIGLKNYIKDYSLIEESEIEKITLWEEYMIYAIIFNNKSHLTKETIELYETIFHQNGIAYVIDKFIK